MALPCPHPQGGDVPGAGKPEGDPNSLGDGDAKTTDPWVRQKVATPGLPPHKLAQVALRLLSTWVCLG